MRCAVVHSKLPLNERNDTLQRFKHGDLDVLWNVEVLTEVGWCRCAIADTAVATTGVCKNNDNKINLNKTNIRFLKKTQKKETKVHHAV